MIDDPIVEDVYRAREKILDECGGNLAKWMERLRTVEAQHPDRLVDMKMLRNKQQTARTAIQQNDKPNRRQ